MPRGLKGAISTCCHTWSSTVIPHIWQRGNGDPGWLGALPQVLEAASARAGVLSPGLAIVYPLQYYKGNQN